MPAGKRAQSNTMLYTVILFVGLFIVTTALAVIFYVKYEKQLELTQTAQQDMQEYATVKEQRSVEKLVGAKDRRESYLGKTLGYIDLLSNTISSTVRSDASAETKVDTVISDAQQTYDYLNNGLAPVGVSEPNQTALLRALEETKNQMENLAKQYNSVKNQLDELQDKFDDAMTASFEKEQKLLSEKDKYQQQVKDIKSDYEQLKAMVKQSSEQKVQTLMDEVEQQKEKAKSLSQNLQKTKAELIMAKNRMKSALRELRQIKPLPENETAAYQKDGNIILVDESLGLVHIDIGKAQQVYPGLTFAVYDAGAAITESGKGKAEIEIFKADENISQARIISSKRPILEGDKIANLVWDSETTNSFVISGEFDLDKDGAIDLDAKEKIKDLITDWGGETTEDVTIDTDYIVLGRSPYVPSKPTFEDLEVHPRAMERYEQAVAELQLYKKVQDRANALSIPVFSYERFLYFIGYNEQSQLEGAF